MIRISQHLIVFLLGSLAFSSCTCRQDMPEVPKAVKRPSGFSASLPTKGSPQAPGALTTPVPPTPSTPQTPSTPATSPTIGEIALPENFPSDVPVFKGAKPFAVQTLAGDARNVLFHTDGAAPEVFNFYQDQMRQQGWNPSQQYQTKEQSFLSFKKGKMITNMTISKDPRTGKQIVAIMYQEEQDLPFPEF